MSTSSGSDTIIDEDGGYNHASTKDKDYLLTLDAWLLLSSEKIVVLNEEAPKTDSELDKIKNTSGSNLEFSTR